MGKVKKLHADKWAVHTEDGRWMATIFMDNDTGTICVYSDWGQYGHWWGPRGRGTRTLREFLAQCNPEYIMDKFSYDKPHYFDEDASIRAIKKDILEARRKRDIDKEQAEDFWDIVEHDLDGASCTTSSEWFYHLSMNAENIIDTLYGGVGPEVPSVHGYHPQLQAFMKECWPIFIEACKKELEHPEAPKEHCL